MKGKTKSILALLGTLLIGIFLGVLIAGQVVRSRVKHMRELRMSGRFTNHLVESVHPTEEQRAIITPILDDFGKRMELMHRRHRTELKENHELLRESLNDHLDEGQMKALKKALQKMSGRKMRPGKGKRKKNRKGRE